MIRSSFSSLSAARLGLLASQNGIDISTQNITNVKTKGYSRQRIDQVSLYNGSSNLYMAIPEAHIGYGVFVTGTAQYRDAFLDVRYRSQMAQLGTYDSRLTHLNEIESVLNEHSDKEGLSNRLSELESALSALQKNQSEESYDNIVRSAAQQVTDFLNQYASQLGMKQGQAVEDLGNDVTQFNSYMEQIHKLTVSIETSQAHGNPALELQDQRNLLLDELSTYFPIKVSYASRNLGSGAAVDSLKIELELPDSTPPTITLMDGVDNPLTLELVEGADGTQQLNLLNPDGTHAADNLQPNAGTFKSTLDMLNKSGAYDDPVTDTNGYGYYQKTLDAFAQKFADVFNKLNDVDSLGDGSQDLFVSKDGSPITAENITISSKWLNGEVRINHKNAAGEPTDVALKMESALNEKQSFINAKGDEVYSGTFHEFLNNMRNILSTDTKSTKSTLDSQLSLAQDIAGNRDSVSGVNIDEETVNLMTYNKAFSASAKVVSTIDEMLTTLVNMI